MSQSLINLIMKPAILSLSAATLGLISCQTNSAATAKLKPMTQHVDLPRYMGDWYVIAHIPTFIEAEAYNAIETYKIADDGTIPTTFTFNKGSFEGPLKTYHPKGFIYDKETNAEWRMQFLWPIKSGFLITYLSPDYQTTIIGVPSRKYAWIMARTKTIPDATYAKLVKELERQGHDISKLRKVPQR